MGDYYRVIKGILEFRLWIKWLRFGFSVGVRLSG